MPPSSPRVALVTGSGKRRVGWHVAQALADRGFALAIHYRTSDAEAVATVDELCRRGVEAVALRADLANEDDVRKLIADTLVRFGQIDVLVNCAAIWKAKKLEEATAADVREHWEANTLGTFLCAQQAGLAMTRQSDGGCIVNFGDWADVRPYLNHAAYFASKGAIPTLTRCLAVELASRNPRVRVNAILPGPVFLPAEFTESDRRRAVEATLVKQEGSPANVAQAVLFFVDNDFVTGTCLPVDGGRTIYAPNGGR
jgi:pteridine reductase